MQVSLRQLRAFITVAEFGSFTNASRRLHVTQSALSLMVKELEHALGVRLMDRGPRGVALTAAGADFHPLAAKVLDDLDAAMQRTVQLRDRRRGVVRVACTPLYSSALIPKVVAAFRTDYPDIDIRVLDTLNEEVLRRVASGEADFGVAPQRRTSPDMIETTLFPDRIDVICPRDHPLAKRKSVAWKQVLRFPFISLTRDFTQRLQADLFASSSELILQPAHEVSFLSTAFGLVKYGQGITAQPLATLPLISPYDLVSVPAVEPVIHRQVSIFTRRDQTLSPAAEGLRDFLIANAARLNRADLERSHARTG
jgi:DNA-binding transcriptional LysR family regulator